MSDYFKIFAEPRKFIAVDASESGRSKDLCSEFSELIQFQWPKKKSDSAIFAKVIKIGIDERRNYLLIAGCSVEHSCIVIALLALGCGFDVYLCSAIPTRSEKSLSVD